MKRFLLLFALVALGVQAQTTTTGSVTLNPAQPAIAAVPGSGTAIAGTGTVATTCTITADAVPAAKITVSCPLGTGGSTASATIVVTPGMNWGPLSFGVNGNVVSVTISQASTGGPISVTATSTVNGAQIAAKTATF